MLVGCLLAVAACGPDGDDAATTSSGMLRPGEVVAAWELDEPPKATTLVDSGPNRLDGRIGAQVLTGVTVQGATGHRREFVEPDQPPVAADRLAEVPDDDRLDPGDRDYEITIRLRTTAPQGNVAQKGQFGADGGYFKIDMDEGRVACLFLGAAGKSHVRSVASVADGGWHQVRCLRSGDELVLWVDDVEVARRTAPTGTIANAYPLVMAGKLHCDQVAVFCDYFSGDLDRMVINRGSSAAPR